MKLLQRTCILFTAMLFPVIVGFAKAQDADGLVPQAESTAAMVVLGEEDLAERGEILRNMYRRITPGNGELIQDIGSLPAAWEEFGCQWNGAQTQREYGAWVVPVGLSQLDGTTVVFDGDGDVLWRGQTDFSCKESADVTLTATLVGEDDWEAYEAVREVVATFDAAGQTLSLPVGEPLRHTVLTNGLRFTSIATTTNGTVQLGIAHDADASVEVFACAVAHTSSWVVATWTNDENVVVTDTNLVWHSAAPPFAGMESAWEWIGSVCVSNGTATFEDTGFSPGNGRVRFYALAEEKDTDGDGLSDGRESFVWHTDSSIADTDGDGWGDGMEAAVGFSPTDAGFVPNVTIHAVMYKPPTNVTHREWVEIYSANSTTVDLSGFRLEVGRNGVWSNTVEFAADTLLPPGRFLLVGESNVANADVQASLDIPNAWVTEPTTGVRLRWGGATNGNVADVVFIGGGNFNTAGLDTTGWLSVTSVWSRTGYVLERRFPGLDTDRACDWRQSPGRAGMDSSIVVDTDGDGLTDAQEWGGTLNPWGQPTNPWTADSDGDGLDDYAECVTYETNPNALSSDGDIWPWTLAGTLASNWPGSDFHEVANGWSPHDADENTNGIPDTWEMVMGLDNLLNGVDSDGDGISDLDELNQNSNPLDPNDSEPRSHLVVYEASKPGWVNAMDDNDIGLGGWVKLHYLGVKSPLESCVWVEEGMEPEEFTMEWESAVQIIEAGGRFSASGRASAVIESGSVLRIQDNLSHPEFDEEYLGGEYAITEHSLVHEVITPGTTLPTDRTELGVCETVHMYLDPPPDTAPVWSATSGYFEPVEGLHCYHACDTADVTTVAAICDGYEYEVKYTVVEPSGARFTYHFDDFAPFPPGMAGAGMWASVFILPDTVSFINIHFQEGQVAPSNVTGYFVGIAENHVPAEGWKSIGDGNMLLGDDHCYSPILPSPWSAGHFQWDIPLLYTDANGHYPFIHTFSSITQHFYIEADGTVEIRKGEAVVRRSP